MYPARIVLELTGVNPKRLRAWEELWGLLSPARSPGNHRRYSESDLPRIREIARMLKQGHHLREIQRLLGGDDKEK